MHASFIDACAARGAKISGIARAVTRRAVSAEFLEPKGGIVQVEPLIPF